MNRKNWLLFLVLLIEGASLMAIELIGAKLVTPFYGNSLYVWTAILCCCVSGLALGYYFGGVLSRKFVTQKILFSILSIAALLVFVLPYASNALISISSNMGLIAGVSFTCFALTNEVNRAMNMQFEEGKVHKTYLAIVRGFTSDEERVDYPLRKENGSMQESITCYRTLERVCEN